ncbi:hypothetical protein NXX23_17595 [Bacteroides ovatus]|nr:hypothetical protein [Bacteroides ovatus]
MDGQAIQRYRLITRIHIEINRSNTRLISIWILAAPVMYREIKVMCRLSRTRYRSTPGKFKE